MKGNRVFESRAQGSGENPSDILRHCAVTRHALSRSSCASRVGAAKPRQADRRADGDRSA